MNKIKTLKCSEDAAYIAGIIDGEGCIMLSKSHSNDGRTPSYTLRLRVKMTDEMVIRWLYDQLGGRFYLEKRKRSNHWKNQYEWSCVGQSAVAVLDQVYPYMKVKQRQADIAYEYVKTLQTGYRRWLSDDVIKRRSELRSAIRVLNS